MAKKLAILVIFGLFLIEHCVCVCLKAETSEGLVDLLDGQRACAPLRNSETAADKGNRFLTCSFSRVYFFDCPANLRYDTRTEACNWPEVATCQTVVPTPVPVLCRARSPQVLPTGPCTTASCQLPNCFCSGSQSLFTAPPMFLMVSFEGPVSTYWFDVHYKSLTVDNTYNLLNPSGCKSRFSYYVNPMDTDFHKVKLLWEAGNEIGLSAQLSSLNELVRIKEQLLRGTGSMSLVDSIKGYRAPGYNVSSEIQFDILNNCSFGYDSSIQGSSLPATYSKWPFTLDFRVQGCLTPPCPRQQYPGLWEVPVTTWVGDNNEACNTPESCVVGQGRWVATEQQWYDFFKRNFLRIYPTKVPMSVPFSSTMFQNYPNAYRGLIRGLQAVLRTRQDVWLVTPGQVISWVKSQQSSIVMKQQRWGC